MTNDVLGYGFTGTQDGMREPQRAAFRRYLLAAISAPTVPLLLRHGDCVGADFEAATDARAVSFYVVGHPPTNDSKRAFFPSDHNHEPKPYLERNADIVRGSRVLLAAPRAPEVIRSGTWATVRLARKHLIPIRLFWPDGTTTYEPGGDAGAATG